MAKRLLVLNGFAIICAVIHHSSHWVLTAMFFWADKYRPVTVPNFDRLNGLSYILLRLIDMFVILGVPAFLFISGIFIAVATGRNRTTIGWDVIFNRVKRLLIPYLLWSGLILLSKYFLGQQITSWDLGRTILTGGAMASYYFVPMLIIFLLLSPFLVPFAKTRWRMLLLVSALVQGTIIMLRYTYLLGYDISGSPQIKSLIGALHAPAYIFWFVLGMVAGFRMKEFEVWIARHMKIFAFGSVVTFILSFFEWGYLRELSGREWIAPQSSLFNQAFILFFLLFFLGLDSAFLLRFRLFSKLGSQSYGIYLVHEPAMEFSARLIYHIAPWFLGYFIPFQAFLVSVGIGVPLLAMEIVNRSPARKFYRYIFG